MMTTRTAKYIFNKNAELYQDKYMQVDLYHDYLNLLCEKVTKAEAKILDVGCGPGNITKYLLSQRSDFDILGIDLAPKMIELAQINNPDAQFEMMNCMDINTLSNQFDAIVSAFCLPYLSKIDALKFIKQSKSQLNPNGILYISTMEGSYDKSGLHSSSSGGPDSTYIYYHQADYLTEYLISQNFEIIKIQRKTHPQQENTTSRDLVILAKKS